MAARGTPPTLAFGRARLKTRFMSEVKRWFYPDVIPHW
jgi:hypothetical protein